MPDSTTSTDLTELGFDADALREKYRIERDKRLRGEGRRQYINVANTGDYSHYLDDPSATPIAREPLVDEVEVAIIGGGFGGLLTGARLRESGVADLRIIEKAADFGRYLVLESISGRGLRHRVLHLHAAAGGNRLYPNREVRKRPGDLRTLPAHRPALRPLPRRAVPDRGRRTAVERQRFELGRVDRSRGSLPREVRGGRQWRWTADSEAARDRGHRQVKGTRSTQPGGISSTPPAGAMATSRA